MEQHGRAAGGMSKRGKTVMLGRATILVMPRPGDGDKTR
jgi:hypothetical protein